MFEMCVCVYVYVYAYVCVCACVRLKETQYWVCCSAFQKRACLTGSTYVRAVQWRYLGGLLVSRSARSC